MSSWSAVTPHPNSTKIPARCSAATSSRAAASSSGSIATLPAASIASRSIPAANASPSRSPGASAARSSSSRSTTSLRRLTSSNAPHAPYPEGIGLASSQPPLAYR